MGDFAILEEGTVINVVVADEGQPGWVDVTGQHVGPGDTYDGQAFTPAPETDEQAERRIASQLRHDIAQAMDLLATAIDNMQIVEGASFANNNQRDNAIRACASANLLALRGVRRLARLTAGLLDAAD